MAHVKIGCIEGGAHSLEVDGVDLSMAVLASGFSVTFPDMPGAAHVHLVVAADTLEMDLPASVLEVAQESEQADYGQQIAECNQHLRTLSAQVKALNAGLSKLPHRTGREVAKGVNKAATAARARR